MSDLLWLTDEQMTRFALRLGKERFQAAFVASRHNPVLKIFADRLRDAGKPHKVIITAIARKLVTIVNALLKSQQNWSAQTA